MRARSAQARMRSAWIGSLGGFFGTWKKVANQEDQPATLCTEGCGVGWEPYCCSLCNYSYCHYAFSNCLGIARARTEHFLSPYCVMVLVCNPEGYQYLCASFLRDVANVVRNSTTCEAGRMGRPRRRDKSQVARHTFRSRCAAEKRHHAAIDKYIQLQIERLLSDR